MRLYNWLVLFLLCFGWCSCEDLIDINLNDAAPQLVIAASVSLQQGAEVTISRTVSFDSEQPFDPVSGAEVELRSPDGQVYLLEEVRPGIYRVPDSGRDTPGIPDFPDGDPTFHLRVAVEGEEFTARASMPQHVPIDSVGTTVSNIFGEERKFVSVKYQDPSDVPNYYRFLRSINGSPFEMVYVTNDKFNDGKYVTEDLADFDTEFFTGDSVIIRMQCIDKPTFDFWNAVQSANPGSAAPANPPSVFGTGALGYFSVYTMSEVSTEVQ